MTARTGAAIARSMRIVVVGVLGAMLAFGFAAVSVAPASAAYPVIPGGPKTLTIHPGIDSQAGDAPGTGMEPGASTPAARPGYAFELKRVPGLKLEQTGDWNRAVAMTPAEAASLVALEPVAAEGVTAPDNSVVFSGLETGLYLVTETASPAGSLPTASFLVTLPLPHPTQADAWLTHVHVYPKTSHVETKLAVRDAAAVTCGDPVRWSASNAIPRVTELPSYRVQHVLADGVRLRGAASDTVVEVTGQPPLTAGADYEVHETLVDGRRALETRFTAAGIAKLLVDTDAEVRISFDSAVSAPGEYTNEVRLFAGDAGMVTDTATTKFGPLRILVHEKGHPSHLIQGADFRLYTSEADARAGKNAVAFADGQELRTSADGLIEVPCLRYSNFADGLDRAPGSELYRDYFAKPVSYPAGWTGEDVILRGSVTSATDPETLRAVVWKPRGATLIPPILSETGGRVVAVAVLGGVLVVGGIVVLARRRRAE